MLLWHRRRVGVRLRAGDLCCPLLLPVFLAEDGAVDLVAAEDHGLFISECVVSERASDGRRERRRDKALVLATALHRSTRARHEADTHNILQLSLSLELSPSPPPPRPLFVAQWRKRSAPPSSFGGRCLVYRTKKTTTPTAASTPTTTPTMMPAGLEPSTSWAAESPSDWAGGDGDADGGGGGGGGGGGESSRGASTMETTLAAVYEDVVRSRSPSTVSRGRSRASLSRS